MIYDQGTDVSSDVYAPAEVRVALRSGSTDHGSQTPSRAKSYTSASAQRVDIDKFTQKLQSITRLTSTQRCARSIRVALESAGAKVKGHPVAAADWGGTLTKIGYRKINPSFENPKKGDIYIIDRNGSSKYGHIAGYSGSNWVSDYKQSGYAVYRNKNVNYSYYRLDH